MITLMETDKTEMWNCWKYGVTMLAATAAAFCARRFAAANREDAARISFSRCRSCTRGAMEYKHAKRKGIDMTYIRKSSWRG
jgi:hypothetical protein